MEIRGCGRWVGDVPGSFAKISGLAGAFLVLALSGGMAAASGQPDFGPNVFIFSPDMSQSEIQAVVNTVANQQVSNQFGTQRYALLFKPGTYGLKKDPQTGKPNPLTVRVGYYTMVAGLGQSPSPPGYSSRCPLPPRQSGRTHPKGPQDRKHRCDRWPSPCRFAAVRAT
jgi:hypothetical protein